MESLEKNNLDSSLWIDKEAFSSLGLVKEGLLSPINSLQDLNSKHKYLSAPFILNPAGKKNQEILKKAKKGQNLNLICENKKVGYIKVEKIFSVDKIKRAKDLSAENPNEFERILSRLGDLGIYGEYEIESSQIKQDKENLKQKIAQYNAKTITAIMLSSAVFHRAYEKLIRDELDSSDLVVAFLLKPYTQSIIDFNLRLESLEIALKNFLINERVCVIGLDDTYLFSGANKVLLRGIVAKNYGCSRFIVDENNANLSIFYENGKAHSVLDNIKDIEVKIKPNYAYCDICRALISKTTCPHGNHHHINYDQESILEFFRVGILPPRILVREEISSRILNKLHPHRFNNLQKIYYNLVPLELIKRRSEEEFYMDLMRLYRM